jgi:hypothetical protein
MKLIDKNITDIISGYDDILRAEIELRTRWRPQLIAAYARRIAILETESSGSKRQQLQTLISALLGAAFTLVGIGSFCRGIIQNNGNTLWYCCGGPILILLGLLISGATWFYHKAPSNPKTRRVPLHPFRGSPLQKGVYPDLQASWIEGLSGGLKDEVPDYPDYRHNNEKDHGAQGERIFIRRLREDFDDRYYLLARLMQRPREDVDLVLIGPKGVWVFEVKHWSGEIYWDDQGWRRVQTYYERGGVQTTKQPDVNEAPDQQWIRAAAQVGRTLQSHAAAILARYPSLAQVRGGIVFTKEEAVLKFQPGRPAFWGNTNFWIKTLHEVEPKADLDRRSTLQLVEALLARHRELAPAGQTRSMQAYARGVLQEADSRLGEWVQG